MHHIAIVDDDTNMVDLISAILSDIECVTTTFNRAILCLERLDIKDTDLLITDVRMPDMDGLELVHRLRQIAPNLPILAVTGVINVREDFLHIKDGKSRSEPDILIKKPFTPEELLLKVEILLSSCTNPAKDPNI